jgi:hypothetical protein
MTTKDGGLRGLFRQKMPEAQWTPVESPVSLGIPDAEYCFPNGAQGWVEFKAAAANAVKVRPGQVGWHLRRHRMGGRSFIAVRRGSELLIFRGGGARDLVDGGIQGAQAWLAYHGTGRGWDWDAVRRVLCGH